MKRQWSYAFCLVPTALTVVGNVWGGYWAAANVLFIVGFLGGLEWLASRIKTNEAAAAAFLPNLWLWMALPACTMAIGSLLWGVYSGILTGGYMAWAVVSTAFHTGAMGIVAAHEFIHRSQKQEVNAGKYLLFLALNPYFFVDHLRVHHRYVGTSRDHATARFGENFYAFLVRSIGGQLREALAIEAAAAQKAGKAAYGWHNYVVRQWVYQAVFLLVLFVLGGFWVVAAFFIQAWLANVLLEYTNYIEHYGILRPDNSRVAYSTSWQCDTWMSRFLLYDLSRHADHHVHGARPYHELRSFEQAPELPGGYASLILPALLPPWWFKLIHPRLLAEQKRLESFYLLTSSNSTSKTKVL